MTEHSTSIVAMGNLGPTIQAGRDIINHFGVDLIKANPVPRIDLDIVADAYVETHTATEANAHINNHGLAIIAGEAGTGRRTAALRALHLSKNGINQYELLADWDDDETPAASTLPTDEGRVYLLDLGARKITEQTASVLIEYGRRLAERGSALVMVTTGRTWPTSTPTSHLIVPASRPDARAVVKQHLKLLRKPERYAWVDIRTGALGREKAGELSDLITRTTAPADAARLARLIIDAEDSEEGKRDVRDRFTQWEEGLASRLTSIDGEVRDRALLLATALVEGADIATVYNVMCALMSYDPAMNTHRLLAGTGLSARLAAMHAEVTDQAVRFTSRPGFAVAALRHTWRHRMEDRPAIEEWIIAVTAHNGAAAKHLDQIGPRLADLAMTESGFPLSKIVKGWGHARSIAANTLTLVTLDRDRGSSMRADLRDWATSTEAAREITARVCGGQFAALYPHQALTRLKRIMNEVRDDSANGQARIALRTMASSGLGGRRRVLDAIAKWATNNPDRRAAAQGFLALIDISGDEAGVLRELIGDAERDEIMRDDTLPGLWSVLLGVHELRDDAYQALVTWVKLAHTGIIHRDTSVEILRSALTGRTPTDAASRFLFGGDSEDDAVKWARFSLLSTPRCPHNDCPVCAQEHAGQPDPSETLKPVEEPSG